MKPTYQVLYRRYDKGLGLTACWENVETIDDRTNLIHALKQNHAIKEIYWRPVFKYKFGEWHAVKEDRPR